MYARRKFLTEALELQEDTICDASKNRSAIQVTVYLRQTADHSRNPSRDWFEARGWHGNSDSRPASQPELRGEHPPHVANGRIVNRRPLSAQRYGLSVFA